MYGCAYGGCVSYGVGESYEQGGGYGEYTITPSENGITSSENDFTTNEIILAIYCSIILLLNVGILYIVYSPTPKPLLKNTISTVNPVYRNSTVWE